MMAGRWYRLQREAMSVLVRAPIPITPSPLGMEAHPNTLALSLKNLTPDDSMIVLT